MTSRGSPPQGRSEDDNCRLTSETVEKVDLDLMLEALGSRGRYQVLQLTLQIFSSFLNVIPTMAVVFIGFQPPDYQCKEIDDVTQLHAYLSTDYVNATITDIAYNQCSMNVTLNVADTQTSQSLPCVAGVNFSMPSDTSFLTAWSLVCDKAGLTELSQTVIFAGQALGAFLTSSLADRYGRRKVYVYCAFGAAAGMFSISAVDSYYLFLLCRVITGFFQTGMVNAAYTMFMELLPQQWRCVASVMDAMMWSSGCILMAAVAYVMQGVSWRYLNLAFASVFVYSLILPWLVDESLRWLVATGNLQEAERILRKACRMNNKDFHVIEMLLDNTRSQEPVSAQEGNVAETYFCTSEAEEENTEAEGGRIHEDNSNVGNELTSGMTAEEHTEDCPIVGNRLKRTECRENSALEGRVARGEGEYDKSSSAKYTLLDLLKHRVVFVPFLVVTFVWVTNNLFYYGLMLGSAQLSGNRFLNFGILAFLETPSTIVALFVMTRFNRKTLALSYGFPTSLFLLVSVLLVQLGGEGVYLTLATVAQYVSKFTVTGSYSLLFVYYMEVFPTAMRAAATGAVAATIKMTNMVTPFIVMWGEFIPWAPGVLISSLVFLATLSILLIPETRHIKLPDTIEEIKAQKKKARLAAAKNTQRKHLHTATKLPLKADQTV